MATGIKATLLVVEDSSTDRERYRRLLQHNDVFAFDVVEAASGEEALEAFKRCHPDCILLDYQLPDTDGIEFLTSIQEISPDYSIPVVVMLTGQGTSTIAVEAMRRGAMDYLVKGDIDAATLNRAIIDAIQATTPHRDRPRERFNILIVEDNPNDRDLYKRLLREASFNRFEFTEVGTGAEGLELFHRTAPDCILLDYNLPDFDGLEFLRELGEIQRRANQPMPVVVVVTGQGNEMVAVEAMKRGVQDYLIKSDLNREVLSRSVASAVEKHALQLRLVDKEREFEQFCYAVAHDLQAPLRRTRQFCELLVENCPSSGFAQAHEYIGLIADNVHSLQILIRDLLRYYSVERIDEPKVAVELAVVLAKAVANLGPLIVERDARVNIASMPRVTGYETPLVQLFQNLIENAIKHNTKPQPQVEVSCFETVRQWQCTVTDNGAGIDRKYHKSLFKPFQRIATAAQVEGTGLGLAICAKVARMHEGYIWIESEPGLGTKLNVLLPK